MNEKAIFITTYLDDYVRMAYRRLIGRADYENELKLIHILYYLIDEYQEGQLKQYVDEDKIV